MKVFCFGVWKLIYEIQFSITTVLIFHRGGNSLELA